MTRYFPLSKNRNGKRMMYASKLLARVLQRKKHLR